MGGDGGTAGGAGGKLGGGKGRKILKYICQRAVELVVEPVQIIPWFSLGFIA